MSSTTSARGLADRVAERTGSGVPKFKTLPPPSLPISTAAASPSSWFAIPPGLSPAELLDSPILLSSSNLLPSPTTGTFPIQGFDWKRDSERGYNSQQQQQQQKRDTSKEPNAFSDFSFQTQAKPLPSYDLAQQTWASHDSLSNSIKPELNSRPEIAAVIQTNNDQQSDHNRRSDDGYNWRKYGQKQVKGSENPRSYYKCTYPNCPTKKKVERSLEGLITEIVYKGTHNHPKPQSTRRSSSSSSASSVVVNQSHAPQFNEIQEQSSSYVSNGGAGRADSSLVVTPDNSSISVGDDDLEQSSQKSRSRGGDEIDDEEHDAKRWKGEGESEGISAAGGLGLGNRAVREPRVVVQTTSDIDILDDGYRWRKYGQKVVKGNPNPRSYYKCTSQGCQVRKHVERASQDPRAVITTYEGKHNHDVPAARGSGSHSVPVNRAMPVPIPNNETNPGSNMRIRPSPAFPHPNYPVQMRMHNSVVEAAHQQVAYIPHHMGGFQEYPGSGSNSMPSSNPFRIANNNDNNNNNHQPSSNGRDSASSFERAKDEPRDINDMFLESLLY